MQNSEHACCTLNMAMDSECLSEAVVVGLDENGKLQIFTSAANKEHIICLLERAKLRLIQDSFKTDIKTT